MSAEGSAAAAASSNLLSGYRAPPLALRILAVYALAMGDLGVIALSFIGGIFLIVITLATGLSLWVSWDVRRRTFALYELLDANQKARQSDIDDMKRVLESGKSVFQSIRAEMKTLMDAQLSEVRLSFKAFDTSFRGAIRNINGKSLAEASGKMVKAVQRLEQVYTALSSVVEAVGETAGTPQEWTNPARADESAPLGESSVSQSIYTRQDVPAGLDEESENEFDRMTGGLFN